MNKCDGQFTHVKIILRFVVMTTSKQHIKIVTNTRNDNQKEGVGYIHYFNLVRLMRNEG
jgi:hypothetical protein